MPSGTVLLSSVAAAGPVARVQPEQREKPSRASLSWLQPLSVEDPHFATRRDAKQLFPFLGSTQLGRSPVPALVCSAALDKRQVLQR